ncbi:MAG: NADH-quinone oxidoreductase subunit N [Fibrobacterota bacterium]|nr:NADH-quinone oxidoreductase subunit N [Fibrobacterota bacterium]
MSLSLLTSMLPDLLLLALALAVLTADIFKEDGGPAFHIAWIGLAGISILIAAIPVFPGDASFAGYIASSDRLVWKLLFTLAALGTVLLSRSYFRVGGNARGALSKPGAYFGLLILCTQGMYALVSATDLLTFYIGLELATLPLFALVAFQPRDKDSSEAGSKYVLMGGFSSALTLFGISFLYGATGSLSFDALDSAVRTAPNEPVLWGGVLFLLGGLGFKLAMAPFHMWAPDVYQGAPTPVMAFLSVGSKAAAVAAAAALFLGPLDALRPALAGCFMAFAVLSMIAGNLGAMRQSHLRRFVAYSSVAQVGYMLMAFLGDRSDAVNALQYNLVTYGVTSFALYFIMGVVGREGPEEFAGLRGLSRRSPGLAALLVLAMFSLAGIPPLAGFLGKFMLFSAAAAQGHYVLVAIAVANAVVSFYYYMLVVKQAYIAEEAAGSAIVLDILPKISMWVLAGLLLALGLLPAVADWLAARNGF